MSLDHYQLQCIQSLQNFVSKHTFKNSIVSLTYQCTQSITVSILNSITPPPIIKFTNTNDNLLRATKGARNPNLNVAFTNAIAPQMYSLALTRFC